MPAFLALQSSRVEGASLEDCVHPMARGNQVCCSHRWGARMHNQGLPTATLTAFRPETSSEKPTLGTAMNVRTWATSLNSCACTRVMFRAHHHKASPIAAAATAPIWLSQ